MKRALLALVLFALTAWAATRLWHRLREEQGDRRVALVADWIEVRELAARRSMPVSDLLQEIESSGFSAVLMTASPLQDYLWGGMTFDSQAKALAIQRQLDHRGVTGIQLMREGKKFKLIRVGGPWDRLKDVKLGYDPELMGAIRAAGLRVALRIEQDQWIAVSTLFEELEELFNGQEPPALLFSSEMLPGGRELAGSWSTWIQNQNAHVLLFEFKPAKAARQMAARNPAYTFRSHTIPLNEVKDIAPELAKARWWRAVRERGCRYLLMHMTPDDSLASFSQKAQDLSSQLTGHGFDLGIPPLRILWTEKRRMPVSVASAVGLLLAIIVPPLSLLVGRGSRPWPSFVAIVLLTVAGASFVAAIADNPLTRLQIIPFRGIKIAVLAAWAGSFLVLFSWSEIQEFLSKYLRRVDLVLLGCLALVGGYLLIRTGNAGASWKAGWEQSVRDRLEFLFVARPRFKEFALGYPLLILGLHYQKENWGRWAIALGMIGPISTVNTFCHLHSPLYLAYWRTLNGVMLGACIGVFLLFIKKCQASR